MLRNQQRTKNKISKTYDEKEADGEINDYEKKFKNMIRMNLLLKKKYQKMN